MLVWPKSFSHKASRDIAGRDERPARLAIAERRIALIDEIGTHDQRDEKKERRGTPSEMPYRYICNSRNFVIGCKDRCAPAGTL
jgi:hypothetical protein